MGVLAADLVVFVFALVALAIIAIPVYKYRRHIKRYMTDEHYGSTWEPDGVTRAERRVIKAQWRLQDAEDHLAWRKEKQKNRTAETEE